MKFEKVHYFQRYAQRENWVTNSTLLLFSRLYHYNPIKFQNIINSILGEHLNLEIGLQFDQQIKENASTPDGIIYQNGFKILIETKLKGTSFNSEQLKNHINSFSSNKSLTEQYSNSHLKILLAISKDDPTNDLANEINNYTNEENLKEKNIYFSITTFSKIINSIEAVYRDSDTEMEEILDDFIALCEEQELIDEKRILAVPTGDSKTLNKKYNIYYVNSERNYNRSFEYIGLYNNKKIYAIGKVLKIAFCDYLNGELQTNKIQPDIPLTNAEKDNIIGIMNEAKPIHDIHKNHKFYIVDEFKETSYEKISSYGIQRLKYFSLNEIDGFNTSMDTEDIAKLLNGKNWS